MSYFVTIGLEIHAAVKSARKLFSSAINDYQAKANTNVDFLDLGLPGTLPVLNFDVVKKAIQLGHFFHMTINYQKIAFDRKNYFYFDLPKGYQISQHYYPIATNGYIELKDQKRIKIIQIQIEEDTAKQTIGDGYLELDYNRSGAPLLEIISEPSFTNASQVLEFLTFLKRSLVFNNISDAKMELGNLRVDLNISLRKLITDPLGSKVEIKNISSFSAIAAAINYEIKRQSALLANNQIIHQQTRRWGEQQQQTIFMRQKSDVVGYSYIPEGNLPEFALSLAEYQRIIAQMPLSWLTIYKQLVASQLTEKQINHILDDYQLYQIVNQVNAQLNNYQKSYKWVGIEILGFLNKAHQNWTTISKKQINELIATILALETTKTINGKQAKIIFKAIIEENLTFHAAIDKYQLKQITDATYLKKLIVEIIGNLADQMTKLLQTNPPKLEKLVIGQVMKQTQGQANPVVVKTVYDQVIKNFY